MRLKPPFEDFSIPWELSVELNTLSHLHSITDKVAIMSHISEAHFESLVPPPM